MRSHALLRDNGSSCAVHVSRNFIVRGLSRTDLWICLLECLAPGLFFIVLPRRCLEKSFFIDEVGPASCLFLLGPS